MKHLSAILTILTCLLFFSFPAGAQGIFDTLKDKAKEETEKKTEEAIEEVTKEGESEKKQEEETNVEKTEANQETKNTNNAPPKDDLKSYSKYDFIPGEKIVYYEDFSSNNVGDFPPAWFTNKSGEVVTTNLFPGKWFQLFPDGLYFMDQLLNLPENFTMEFDVIPVSAEGQEASESAMMELILLRTTADDPYPSMGVPGEGGVIIKLSTSGHSITGYSDATYGLTGTYEKEKGLLKMKEINHLSIWVQKTRIRVYMHGDKIFDIPKAFKPGMLINQFRIWEDYASAPMISNLRIAEAGADMRSKLITEGKLVTTGILFDVNSDKIKPESYGVLKEIAKVLTDNPEVKVKIVGHTDSDGTDESNMDLSKRRALSVKNSLNGEFSIDATRMETDGKGESMPVDKNDTPQGKANNRRVEFVKM